MDVKQYVEGRRKDDRDSKELKNHSTHAYEELALGGKNEVSKIQVLRYDARIEERKEIMVGTNEAGYRKARLQRIEDERENQRVRER